MHDTCISSSRSPSACDRSSLTLEEPDMSALNRILLVEDNEEDVELTLAALKDLKLANEVVVARDGVEALDYLYRRGTQGERVGENPVVVLLDLKMPRVDGLQVLREIKNDEALKTTPVVMLTSSRE